MLREAEKGGASRDTLCLIDGAAIDRAEKGGSWTVLRHQHPPTRVLGRFADDPVHRGQEALRHSGRGEARLRIRAPSEAGAYY